MTVFTDVIQDVLKDVNLEAIIASVFDGKESDLDRFLAQNNQEIEKEFKCQIEAQQKAIAHSPVDYKGVPDFLKRKTLMKSVCSLSTFNYSLNGHSNI